MSSTWSALHAQLVRSVNRHSATTVFGTIFPPINQCRAFRDPSHLLDWLHAPRHDAAAKNDVLSHLLHTAVSKDRAGDLAVELLLLALWPGLCVIRRRLWTICRNGMLDADLLSGLTLGIRRARPERITRVAATLLRNLERDLRRLYSRDDQVARKTVEIDAVAHMLAARDVDPPERLMSAAAAALGEDGALIAAVHIAGLTQKEAAEQLGISHEAARKRCQRALCRLKNKKDA